MYQGILDHPFIGGTCYKCVDESSLIPVLGNGWITMPGHTQGIAMSIEQISEYNEYWKEHFDHISYYLLMRVSDVEML